MLNYEQLVHIDENNLQASWLCQANRYMHAVKAECDAKKQVAELEEKLQVVEAEATKALRESYATAKASEKPTETFFKQEVAQNADVRAVKTEIREAEYQKSMMSGLRQALDHRANGLRDLVQMAVRNLKADPTLPGVTRTEVEEVMTSVRQKQNPIRPPRR